MEIGDIKFTVTETFIAEATELPRVVERWFKKKEFHNESWKVIVKNLGMDILFLEMVSPAQRLKINGGICS